MTKFYMTSTDETLNGSKVISTIEFDVQTLDDVVENMEQFLRGAGFIFNGLEYNPTINKQGGE